jgi:riboflavin kinase/FMN adenylyltransferase
MIITEGLEGFRHLVKGTAMSIGNFDGIHRGHRSLLAMADRLRESSPGGVAIVTFDPHPLTVLRPADVPPQLTPLALKQAILEESGVDTLVLLRPTREVLGLTAEQFWQIIVEEVRPAHLIEGESFTFGKGRGGTMQKLRAWAAQSSVHFHVAEPVQAVLLNLSIVTVSSSLIRWLIALGRVRDAAICLGRPYRLSGEVIKGHQRGRTIGTPTANLRITGQLIPGDGVYAGRAVIDGVSHPAAISIGTLPTFEGAARQIEAHLLDFSGDLYGRELQLDCTDWLREQRKYSSVDALREQITEDLQSVRARQGLDAAREICGTAALGCGSRNTAEAAVPQDPTVRST